MPSPEAAELWKTLRAAPDPEDLELEEQREADELVEDPASDPAGVRYDRAAPLDGLWATPGSWDGRSTVLYLFGGGYVASSPGTRKTLAGHLARAAAARVAVPDYRLAPEHPFPAALEDAIDAYRWLITDAGADLQNHCLRESDAGRDAKAKRERADSPHPGIRTHTGHRSARISRRASLREMTWLLRSLPPRARSFGTALRKTLSASPGVRAGSHRGRE